MIVPVENDVGVVVIEQRIEPTRILVGSAARREKRNVIERQSASGRMGLEIVLEPDVLRVARRTTAYLAALRIQSQ